MAQALGKAAVGACGSEIRWGFLVLAARCGRTMLKVRKGQEREHMDRLAGGPGVPDVLDGRSSLAPNNVRLGLCHEQPR